MKLPASSTVQMPSLPTGWSIAALAILSSGRLAIIGDDQEVVAHNHLASPVGFDPDAYEARVRNARARLWTFDGSALTEQFDFPLESPFPAVDQLPDGRWVIVARRTLEETNARLFDSGGTLLSRFMLGDGIQGVQCDGQDRIWVGWFDEGVFGNTDWRIPGREWPPSSSAVAAFDSRGQVVWEHPRSPENAPADCYALNVAGDAVWTWMYAAPAIQRLMIGTAPEIWGADAAGATAIAVQEGHVLVAGGYGPAAGTIRLLKLTADGAVTLSTWDVDLPDPGSWHMCQIEGREDRVHMITPQTWRQWRVGDAQAAFADGF